MTGAFDPQRIFERLDGAGVRYVLIGGWAVIAHGHQRLTQDVDICPDPERENLVRLAGMLAELDARQLGMEDFDPSELPGDPTDPDSLAKGGNFRTETQLGVLDVMQWVLGESRELGYEDLARDGISAEVFGLQVRISSLAVLLEMKRAARRPKDLEDLAALDVE
ncbi:MAG: nucleotidyltransferase domain-containing protein [Solirubrobacteraceae bacterium]